MTDNKIENELDTDNLQRFIFDNKPVRGEWVQLDSSWKEVLVRREYPVAIQKVLGEMMAAAALLAATIKIKGRLILQTKSNGPASVMMVECTSNNTLRAFAQWKGDVADDADLLAVTGDGTLAITIEVEGAKQPYQGVVSLAGDSMSGVLETYFQQSEQLATRIWLAADDQVASGLFLQQLPSDQDEQDEEHWSRISQLAATVTTTELLTLDSNTLLHRLFHEEECRLLVKTDLRFACSCSRDRVEETIKLLGKQDAFDLLEEHGKIEIACEFCNEHYHFDNVDVTQVFVGSEVEIKTPDSETQH
ncbi:MAG: Hsp33 family molecular chaperone HslO [Gammaproteobacteria bacterium]|nr:MAG: Hsp33 family molecular chaperone HslO [Gammaproteobacteria bacterium]